MLVCTAARDSLTHLCQLSDMTRAISAALTLARPGLRGALGVNGAFEFALRLEDCNAKLVASGADKHRSRSKP